MEGNAKFDSSLLAAAGVVAGAAVVLSVAHLLEEVLDRDARTLARRCFSQQDAGLPIGSPGDSRTLERLASNAEALDARTAREFEGRRCEECSIVVDGGAVRLSAQLAFASSESRFWAVLTHPYRSDRHSMDRVAALYLSHGFNVANLDLRAHGASEGRCIGLGWLDGDDILAWLRYLDCRFGGNIGVVLHGTSMGAAACMNAAAWNLGPQISALVSDSGFATFRDVALRIANKYLLVPGRASYEALRLANRLRGSFDFDDNRPVEAVANVRVPSYFINGSLDEMVPPLDAAKLYSASAAPCKHLYVVPEAGHAGGLLVNPQAYETRLFGFLAEQGLC